jgi:hypothetical protein
MKPLPLGITDFAEIRQYGCFYADKTRLLYELVRRPAPYFLSRPRRFGKSLVVNALEYILRGRRDLFKGLWIDGSDYDWIPHPVIKLSMTNIKSGSPQEVEVSLFKYLTDVAQEEDIDVSGAPSSTEAFGRLICKLYRKYDKNKVAILIDDYDAPITRNFSEPVLAEEIRRSLFDFYCLFEAHGTEVGHFFMTGVACFSPTSIFKSPFGWLKLTCHEDFADVCGLNYAEFDELLDDRLADVLEALKINGVLKPDSGREDLRNLVLDWYGGYSWDRKMKVLNPWSVFTFLEELRIGNYWHDSATPAFLKKLFAEKRLQYDLAKEAIFFGTSWNSISEIDEISPEVLLFQTGCLTIKKIITAPYALDTNVLGAPNLEVALSLVPLLFSVEPPINPILAQRLCRKAFDSLFKLDKSGFEAAFNSYLNQYPADVVHRGTEKYYHTLLLTALMLADIHALNEDMTCEERCDVCVSNKNGDVFFIEVKYVSNEQKRATKTVVKPGKDSYSDKGSLSREMTRKAKAALKQIEKKYVRTFLGGENKVYKVALVVEGPDGRAGGNRRTKKYLPLVHRGRPGRRGRT